MPVLGVVVAEGRDAGGVEPSVVGADVGACAGVGTTGIASSLSPNDGGIPVKRYSTARSGLL